MVNTTKDSKCFEPKYTSLFYNWEESPKASFAVWYTHDSLVWWSPVQESLYQLLRIEELHLPFTELTIYSALKRAQNLKWTLRMNSILTGLNWEIPDFRRQMRKGVDGEVEEMLS